MRLTILLLIFIALLPVNIAAQPVTTESGGEVLAKVGNREITRQMLDHIIATISEENRVPFLTPDGRKKILDEVISFMLFAEAAKAQGIDEEPAIKTRLNTCRLSPWQLRRYLAKTPPPSEETLITYYKDNLSEFKPPEEIKARHILKNRSPSQQDS